MKIIDLLNKKAKGEEMPRKIIFNDNTYLYNLLCEDYEDSYSGVLLFEDRCDANKILNREVEIIEEEKEIEKLKIPSVTEHLHTTGEDLYVQDMKVYDKINELIDVINDMRDKE